MLRVLVVGEAHADMAVIVRFGFQPEFAHMSVALIELSSCRAGF